MEGDFETEEGYRGIFLVLIVATLILIVVMSFYAAKIEEGRACFGHKYGNTSSLPTELSSYELSDSDSLIYQKYKIGNNGNIRSEFCYSVYGNGSTGFKISVLVMNGSVLGSDFIGNESGSYCTVLNGDLSEESFIGLRCDSCNENRSIILNQEILGTSVDIVYEDASGVSWVNDNTLKMFVISKEDCRGMITFFIRWYITLLGFLGVGLLILLGTKKFRRELLEDD